MVLKFSVHISFYNQSNCTIQFYVKSFFLLNVPLAWLFLAYGLFFWMATDCSDIPFKSSPTEDLEMIDDDAAIEFYKL